MDFSTALGYKPSGDREKAEKPKDNRKAALSVKTWLGGRTTVRDSGHRLGDAAARGGGQTSP